MTFFYTTKHTKGCARQNNFALRLFTFAFFYLPSLDLEAWNFILKTGKNFDRTINQTKCSSAAESRAGNDHSSTPLFLRHKRQSNDLASAALDCPRV